MDWLKEHISRKYVGTSNSPSGGTTTQKKSNNSRKPAIKDGNPHRATIDLINKILHKSNCPDNIKVDTLRLLALMLEAEKEDNYTEKEFMKFLNRDNKKAKIKTAKPKATGGWIVTSESKKISNLLDKKVENFGHD